MKNILWLFFAVMITFMHCKKDDLNSLDTDLQMALENASATGDVDFFVLPGSNDYRSIPQDPRNPITEAKVQLGQMLFHDTRLGVNPKLPEGKFTYSCASCHHAQGGFQACLKQGIGEGGIGFGLSGELRKPNTIYAIDSLDVQPIRSPTILNGAYQSVMLWNGSFGANGPNAGTQASWDPTTPQGNNALGYDGMETQAIGGLKVHRLGLDDDILQSIPLYKELLDQSFPEMNEQERYSNISVGLAMAAFERTVLANEAPFQKYLKGDGSALTRKQKQGALLFFGKAKCVSCHTGPALSSMEFHALGMPDLLGPGIYGSSEDNTAHLGRGGWTGNDAELYQFKVPQLYSLTYSPFYGHGGSFTEIRDVIDYKNKAIKANESVPDQYLSDQFQPLGLSDEEIDQLTDFVANGLKDSRLDRYVPGTLPSGLCFPNNDGPSQEDLGCK